MERRVTPSVPGALLLAFPPSVRDETVVAPEFRVPSVVAPVTFSVLFIMTAPFAVTADSMDAPDTVRAPPTAKSPCALTTVTAPPSAIVASCDSETHIGIPDPDPVCRICLSEPTDESKLPAVSFVTIPAVWNAVSCREDTLVAPAVSVPVTVVLPVTPRVPAECSISTDMEIAVCASDCNNTSRGDCCVL